MAKITVVIEQGDVKAVHGIPVDVYVEIRNYDPYCPKMKAEESVGSSSGALRNNLRIITLSVVGQRQPYCGIRRDSVLELALGIDRVLRPCP